MIATAKRIDAAAPYTRLTDAGGRLPTYTLPDTQLGMGASFGNSDVWINTKNTGAIERVFSVALGHSAIGSIVMRYAITGKSLGASWDAREHEPAGSSYIALRPDGPLRTFELHPAYQRCTFTLAESIQVSETTFVPFHADDAGNDPAAAYQIIELHNASLVDRRLRITGFAQLRGTLSEDVAAEYLPELRAFGAYNKENPATARFFGIDVAPTSYETTFDVGSVYDPAHSHSLGNTTSAQGDVLGALQLDIELKPGETRRCSFIAAAFANELPAATERYSQLPQSEPALKRTISHLEEVLARGRVLTPDPVINDAALWSKVNMRRVMARYPEGPAFTNEPGVSSNIVIRDAAWFVYGNDHFMPEFSRELLDKLVTVQYPSGKMPEYFNAITGHIEDDGLNINDDTPLFILAVNHHFRSTGDFEWLKRTYGVVNRAALYIISQIDKRGLVFCDARDPRGDVWAIASWRNIISGYSINGAVTEINAECVAALRAAGHLAEESGHSADAQPFFDAATRVREAMDRHLVNPENGLYYLNIDVDGNVHTDVTGDLVFPVMFRACDEETGFRIISRLNSPDFYTPAGLRTVSRNDPRYDPAAYAGLLGGVWPGLTWWYAFAAARYHPDFMVKALRSSFEHYASNPRKNNTVPGQFSEWFDGEALTNKGMRLSPWEPPRFLWAAVEGVCGLTATPTVPRVKPLIPPNWKWLALCNLPYHGDSLSYFVARQEDRLHLYSTGDVETDCTKELYDQEVSDRVAAFSQTAPVVAFQRSNEIIVFVGNIGSQTASIPLQLEDLLEADAQYSIRVYNSEQEAWEPEGHHAGSDLTSLVISIESQGYRLIRLQT